MNQIATVHALVLAGGSSSRMRRDKAALLYQGESQLDRVFALALRHVPAVYVSVRRAQSAEPARAAKPLIIDSVEGDGPIVGIRSSLAAFPGIAWLVIACDLPYLSDVALAQLLAERDPHALATAFVSRHDGLPEPLCAVWEPGAAAALAEYHAGGGRCPRQFLLRHRTKLLEPLDPNALDNVNTPEEYAQAVRVLDERPYAGVKRLTVQYFAVMREQAGRSEETFDTDAATPDALLRELRSRYAFTLPRDRLKVAVNGDFAAWSHPLRSGDAVVFLPPVAGG